MDGIYNIQLPGTEISEVRDAVYSIAGKFRYYPVESAAKSDLEICILNNVDACSIVMSNNQDILDWSVEFSRFCEKPVINLKVHLPYEWRFWVSFQGNIEVEYSWVCDLDSKSVEREIEALEEAKMAELGLMGSIGSERPRKRIQSSDPRLELAYRERLAGDILNPAAPYLSPEIPKKLAGLFVGRTAARFRKILGKPHLSVENMLAEFANYLGMMDAFLTWQSLENPSSGDDDFLSLKFQKDA